MASLAAQHTSAVIKRLISGTLATLAPLLYCTKQLYCCIHNILHLMRELWLVPSWRTNLPRRALPKGGGWLCFESGVTCKSICTCNDHALISQTLEHLLASLVQPHILLGARSNADGIDSSTPNPSPFLSSASIWSPSVQKQQIHITLVSLRGTQPSSLHRC